MKIEFVKVPSFPAQETAPEVLAELLIKIEFLKIPLSPFHSIAPPLPLVKLKFKRILKIAFY